MNMDETSKGGGDLDLLMVEENPNGQRLQGDQGRSKDAVKGEHPSLFEHAKESKIERQKNGRGPRDKVHHLGAFTGVHPGDPFHKGQNEHAKDEPASVEKPPKQDTDTEHGIRVEARHGKHPRKTPVKMHKHDHGKEKKTARHETGKKTLQRPQLNPFFYDPRLSKNSDENQNRWCPLIFIIETFRRELEKGKIPWEAKG